MNIDIQEIIKERVSVRTFDANQPLSVNEIAVLNKVISETVSPFGGKYKIELKKFDFKGPQRPSTYGTVSGASWYILMSISEDDISVLSAGFVMEHVILKATELGLGTCWMGVTFKKSDFFENSGILSEMPLKIISPVGYPAKKRSVRDSMTRLTLNSSKRKPMDFLFWEGEFGKPISETNQFYEALSMMRLAPSAKNKQPWRALVRGNTVYFYYEFKSEASILDLGIGLCHFDLTMKASGKSGVWSKITNSQETKNLIPVVKFILRE